MEKEKELFTAYEIIKAIRNYGNDINTLSKETNIPKETIRYWFKEKKIELYPIINYHALGLNRLHAFFEPKDIRIAEELENEKYCSKKEIFENGEIHLILFSSRKVPVKDNFLKTREVKMRNEYTGKINYSGWLKEFEGKKDELFYPEQEVKVDEIDKIILKNPFKKNVEIAGEYNLDKNVLGYHKKRHVKNKLILGYDATYSGLPKTHLCVMDFDSERSMYNIIYSLSKEPFVQGLETVYDEKKVLANLSLEDESEFLEYLYELVKKDVIKNFKMNKISKSNFLRYLPDSYF